ncbi:VOC family protein [Paenibacillus sp. Leaf72]|uniref:VOC family protein n=1 Tax=Paenibacillus sp. Leaf72 TaxID=1736234 RepID=UPI0006F84C2F|nr:VOC family protein [Paenibacillus sp. Leaf72]KQN97704.1 hypothetical protein ASF12_21125 [Paenibacillus sp. Leaf72]
MKVHHIGYVVEDLDKALQEFIALGYEVDGEKCHDDQRNILIQFIKNGSYLVELVCPLNDNSPVKNILKKVGSTPYHFCYETANLLEKTEQLKKLGYLVIAEALAAPAIGNKRVVFLFKNNMGIIELVEE